MLDEVTQEPLVGIPNRSRIYKVTARGFCTEPARAVNGKGAVLVSRFDYAGRVDFASEDKSSDATDRREVAIDVTNTAGERHNPAEHSW